MYMKVLIATQLLASTFWKL